MKNLFSRLPILFIFSFVMLFGSCSDYSVYTSIAQEGTKEDVFRDGVAFPGNMNNPYDAAGRLHNELFETYYDAINLPVTLTAIAARVDAIANTHSEFSSMKTPGYQPVSAERVQYLIEHPNNCVEEIIGGTGMTSPAKVSLTNFISNITLLFDEGNSYDILYEFITNYETNIIDNINFTAKDKEIILTASSIARYSMYMSKKRPKKNTDPDWTIFIGNIAAGIEGVNLGKAEAIAQALATGIAENQ